MFFILGNSFLSIFGTIQYTFPIYLFWKPQLFFHFTNKIDISKRTPGKIAAILIMYFSKSWQKPVQVGLQQYYILSPFPKFRPITQKCSQKYQYSSGRTNPLSNHMAFSLNTRAKPFYLDQYSQNLILPNGYFFLVNELEIFFVYFPKLLNELLNYNVPIPKIFSLFYSKFEKKSTIS